MADLLVAPQSVAPSYTATLAPYAPVFLAAFFVSFLLTPVGRVLARRHGIVDAPDAARKVHRRSVPYLGGLALFFGWLAGVLTATVLRPHDTPLFPAGGVQIPFGILLGAAAVVLTGLVDDAFQIGPKWKVVGQAAAALLLLVPGVWGAFGPDFFLGTGDRTGLAWMVLQPLINLDYLPRAWEQSAAVAAVAAAASCAGGGLLVVTACNATNLLDGLDGLSGGATGILSLGYLALALYLACTGIMSSGGTPADPLRITLAFALLGAICGFIPYNFHPASIFMGDMGSMFLGYVSAALILLFAQFGTSRWFFAALVMYGLPLMDTLLAVIRRTRAGRPVFSADAGHFHHWLLRRGFGMRRAVLVGYAVAAVCVGLGLIVVVLPTKLAFSVYVVAFGWTLVGAAKMGLMGDSAAATDAPADSQEGDLWKKRHRPSRAPRHF